MAGRPALGTKLYRGDGLSPQTFQEVKHCGDTDVPAGKRNFENSTTHTSADNGGFEEYEPTTLDAEPLKTPINLDTSDPVHLAILQDEASGTKRDWKVRLNFPTPLWVKFSGYVVGVPVKAPVKGLYSADLEIKVTGAVTKTESELP
ncbi:MAG TPA: hypothetical protein PKN47_01580 [Nitrospira sp.]|nr:hypothetical protein [Nitrospira sp.]